VTLFTLNGWRTSATNGLVESIPLQTFDDALILVDEYIATVGGWIPSEITDPTGEGVLNTGESPTEAIASIVDGRLDRVHRLQATMNVEVNLDFITNFAIGQSDEDIIAQMQPLIEAFVQRQLTKSPLSYVGVTDLSGVLLRGGDLNAQERVDLEVDLAAGQTLQSPLAVAVRTARTLYGLDNTWTANTVYTEPNSPIVVIIRKFVDTSFASLEQGIDQQYVINVNQDDYNITGGVISPVDIS